MSDFIKELEEDIKEEQLINLWKKYGKYVIGMAVAIVLGAIAYPIYNNYQESQSLKAAETYKQALRYLEKGREDKAIELFDQLIAEHKGYGKLAKLQKAGALTNISMKEGKISLMDEVQRLYQAINAHNAKDPSLRGLAVVLEAYRAVSMGEEGAWETQLQPLSAPGQPWRGLALEVLALNDLKHGRQGEAGEKLVEVLKDKETTPTTRNRAMLMLSSLSIPTMGLATSEQ